MHKSMCRGGPRLQDSHENFARSACKRAVARACCCFALRVVVGGASAGLKGRGTLGRSSRCSLRRRQPGWGSMVSGAGRWVASHPSKAVIVNHLTEVRLRVVWDPRGFSCGVGVSSLIAFAINESGRLLVTARQWATDRRELASKAHPGIYHPRLGVGLRLIGRFEFSERAAPSSP